MLFEGRRDEVLRIASARATERIAKRWGDAFPMWIGCGYPKSGTVWLCKLMASYLGVPYPQNYRLPIAMASVIHAHWEFDPRLSRVAYIHRDGRDIMVSYYFHQVREMQTGRNPQAAAEQRRRFARILGERADVEDVRANLPRFIEAEFSEQNRKFGTWHEHVRSWSMPRREGVSYVSYESLRSDPTSTLASLMADLTGGPADEDKIQLACARLDFALVSGRQPGQEDRASFLRSGQVGDWRQHFDADAAEVFHAYAGDVLVDLGYADANWHRSVGR